MNGKKTGGCLLLLVIAVALSWGGYECKYHYSKWSDYRNSPWAYSDDAEAKLLVGRWEGSFVDPDQVKKTISLEVLAPLTDEERGEKASKRWKKASYSTRNKNRFDGIASVTSKLGTEQYEINGHVEKENMQKLSFGFQPVDEKKRILPNFTLFEAKNGTWDMDKLTTTLNFSYHWADGSSHWNSADPRHAKQVTVNLKRVSVDR
ncbi:MAG: hypothetical protein ABIN80_26250 [Dyadobacter sp.]|uniref:hypothetical protein n=1 Tax=Dyadobacter sp. TaxID=1914288 RepID=UPI003263D196